MKAQQISGPLFLTKEPFWHQKICSSVVAMFLWESQRLLGRVRRWFFAYLSGSKGSQRYHCSFESAENGWTHPVRLTSHLSHLINETENGMSSTSLPSRGLPGKLYQLTLSSLVGSFRSWNPRIPPSCRDFAYTARALWWTYLFSIFHSHYQGRKVGNWQTPQCSHIFRCTIGWSNSGDVRSTNIKTSTIHPTDDKTKHLQHFTCFFLLLKSRGFPSISRKKKKRCFFCWHNFKLRFGSHEGGTFAITKTSHGDGRW